MRALATILLGFLVGCAAPTAEGEAPHGDPRVIGPEYGSLEGLTYEKRLGPAQEGGWRSLEARDEAAGADFLQAPREPQQKPAPEPSTPLARQVIYSASVRVVVVSPSDALAKVQVFAEEAGGYLQRSDAGSITVRVPAAKFEATLLRIASLGEVVDRSIEASDVTEQMFDLELRLDNLRRTRERLVEHLAKSDKIEDTLKIEAELSRVSGEIEQLEGRLRFLQSQVALSTIRVELNQASPHRGGNDAGLSLPFRWVAGLGDGLVAGEVSTTLKKRPWLFYSGPDFDPPDAFIRYYNGDTRVEALDSDGLRLKVVRNSNYDRGELAFWTKLARNALVRSRLLVVSEERDLGDGRALIRGTREVAGTPYGYLLVVLRTKKRVTTFEAWGPAPAFDARFEELLKSAQSLER